MAIIYKTLAENIGDHLSTWTLGTGLSDIVANTSSVTITMPKIWAKYSRADITKTRGYVYGILGLYSDERYLSSRQVYQLESFSWSADSSLAVPPDDATNTVYTSRLFSTHNPTQRSVPLTFKFLRLSLTSDGYVGSNREGGSYSFYNGDDPNNPLPFGDVATITLDAPPTFSNTDVSFDTNYVYTGLTTASVDVSALSAKYGGYITSAELKIGAQTATLTGDATNILSSGTLSILLNTEGTFTPTITVTDSRGQTTTKTLPSITVSGYVAPSVSFTVARTNASGVADDEGTSAVLTATIDYVSMGANLTQPTVTVDGVTESVTWYTDRALSSAVNWTSYNPTSPITLYGFINGGLAKESSYSIGVTPNDSKASGTEITQTLGGAFYTIDFLAGGHGIAFGQPAVQEGFFCNMDAHFKDKANIMRALFDFVYPIGSYYETSDTSFDPNDTWGGTWVLEAEGQVHVSAGANYAVNGALTNASDGGEATHLLTVDEMPSHNHNFSMWGNGTHYYPSTGSILRWYSSAYNTQTVTVSNTGGGQAHNNMQPYIIVNRWHRTA